MSLSTSGFLTFRNVIFRRQATAIVRKEKEKTSHVSLWKTDMVAHSPNWIAFPTVVNDSIRRIIHDFTEETRLSGDEDSTIVPFRLI
jgi:hypothetical protein